MLPKTVGQKRSNDINSVEVISKVAKTEISPTFDFRAQVFLQCHSKSTGSNDFSTQVWSCVFEPDKNDSTRTTSSVATCGGNTVCIINCETTKVHARFCQRNEEFYAVAWTTLSLGSHKTNVLVCAGCLGFVHLIHPDQDTCYGRIKAHSSPIQTLLFSPTSPTHLLTADKKGNIYLIDIDTPTLPEYKFSWKKLLSFKGACATPLKLLVPDEGKHLLCATEGGLFCWKTAGFVSKQCPKTVTSISELTFPFVGSDEPIVDALTMLDNGVIVMKCAQQGSIVLWDFDNTKTKISSSKKVSVDIIAKLRWSLTKQSYLNVAACHSCSVVAAGDDKGRLWLYNASYAHGNKSKSFALVEPENIIPFPLCAAANGSEISDLQGGTIYNDITCSFDFKYIVVASDNNVVGIYKRKET